MKDLRDLLKFDDTPQRACGKPLSSEYGTFKTQSRPGYGLGFQVKFLFVFEVVPASLGRGCVKQGCVSSKGFASAARGKALPPRMKPELRLAHEPQANRLRA